MVDDYPSVVECHGHGGHGAHLGSDDEGPGGSQRLVEKLHGRGLAILMLEKKLDYTSIRIYYYDKIYNKGRKGHFIYLLSVKNTIFPYEH